MDSVAARPRKVGVQGRAAEFLGPSLLEVGRRTFAEVMLEVRTGTLTEVLLKVGRRAFADVMLEFGSGTFCWASTWVILAAATSVRLVLDTLVGGLAIPKSRGGLGRI